MNGIAGVVVLFQPDEEELITNIRSYLPFIDMLFLIDNTGSYNAGLQKKITELPGKINYKANSANAGIAAALNAAATLAQENNFRWLLTMDQDSYFKDADITAYFHQFNQLFFNNPLVALVAPSVKEKGQENAEPAACEEVVSVITSGSLLQLSIWKEAGKFDEKLFIDEVDHEYCYRVFAKGFTIIRFNNIKLQHKLGTKKLAGYFRTVFKSSRTIHSPARVYFIVRNYLYVRKKYKALLPEVFKIRDWEMLTILKNNLLFSGKSIQQLKSIFRGMAAYRKGDFSAKI